MIIVCTLSKCKNLPWVNIFDTIRLKMVRFFGASDMAEEDITSSHSKEMVELILDGSWETIQAKRAIEKYPGILRNERISEMLSHETFSGFFKINNGRYPESKGESWARLSMDSRIKAMNIQHAAFERRMEKGQSINDIPDTTGEIVW